MRLRKILFIIAIVTLMASLLMGCSTKAPPKAASLSYVTESSTTNFTINRPTQWKDISTPRAMRYAISEGNSTVCNVFISTMLGMEHGGIITSSEQYLATLQTGWRSQASGKIESTTDITLAGRPAKQSVATVTVKGVAMKTWQVVAQTPAGDYVRVAYTCPVDQYNEYIPVMERALASFSYTQA